MTGHVTAWIPAYHDGELFGARQRQVEEHLAGCPTCQAELVALERLSAVLRAAPDPVSPVPVERFAAQVNGRLDRRPERARRHGALGAAWLAVPVGLVVAWAFLQVILFLAGLAGSLGLGGPLTHDLLSQARFWPALPGLVSLGWLNVLLEAFAWMGLGGTRFSLGFIDLSLTLLTGALLWAWLAGWWAFHNSLQNSSRRLLWITSKS